MIKIIIENSAAEAEEFADYLNSQGYDAYVEPPGRHGQGQTIVENYDGDEEELLRKLWEQYCLGEGEQT